KDIAEVQVVFSGAGAAAIATAAHYVRLGGKREYVVICHREGVVYVGRHVEMGAWKSQRATTRRVRTMAEAPVRADDGVALSVAGALPGELVLKMADRPIIFALANPMPEILPQEVLKFRQDAIIATGRSDYPNQVNNVLGFPFLFRGALDVRATEINEEMK